jgi:hypothetical protein
LEKTYCHKHSNIDEGGEENVKQIAGYGEEAYEAPTDERRAHDMKEALAMERGQIVDHSRKKGREYHATNPMASKFASKFVRKNARTPPIHK